MQVFPSQCEISEIRTLNDYLEDYVMRMGVDAEGPLVDLGILFSLLSAEGSLVMFDRR